MSVENQTQQLKLNVTNIHSFLLSKNKEQQKFRRDKINLQKRKISFEKKQQEEKILESVKTSSISNIAQSVAESPKIGILDKIFNFGGLLLTGILVNAVDKIVEEGKKFYNNNKKLFDTIGNFLSSVKDAVVGLLDSFTGPESEKGAFDHIGKFDDTGKLMDTGSVLNTIEDAFDGLGDMINTIDKTMGGSGTAGNALKKPTPATTPATPATTPPPATTTPPAATPLSFTKPKPSPDNKPVPSGGTLDFIGSGDGITGKLIMKDGKGKKVGSWEAVSGIYRTANATQNERRTVSGTYNPLPDGTYPLMSLEKHSYADRVGTWSTPINNLTGTIGNRSQILIHNDIGSDGTAGCLGVELGGISGTAAEREFLRLYESINPKTLRVAIGKGNNTLTSSAPTLGPDNKKISPVLNQSRTTALNTPDPRSKRNRRGRIIALQRVNTLVPYTITVPVSSSSSGSSTPITNPLAWA